MSWVSENKFLTGFGAVMLVGLGTLGYFTYSAMDKYDAATGKFDTAANDLKRVEGTKPSPKPANLKELEAQKQEVAEKLDALQKDLKSRVLAIEPMKKEAFQDRLKETVARVTAKAAERHVILQDKPEKFYMGYGKYQSAPPNESAAPVLARQLRAIELIMDTLMSAGEIEFKELKREDLPEETGIKRTRSTDQGGGKKKTGKDSGGESSGQHLVEKSTVTIKFVSKDSALRQVLNALTSHKQQFFIVRRVDVLNEHTESPPKVALAAQPAPPAGTPDVAPPPEPVPAPGVTPSPAPAPEAAPAPAARQGSLVYAFGKEKIEATIEIEILDFAEPDARPEKSGKGKGKQP